MKLQLTYPVKPLHLNQGFGANTDYYYKFHDLLGILGKTPVTEKT